MKIFQSIFRKHFSKILREKNRKNKEQTVCWKRVKADIRNPFCCSVKVKEAKIQDNNWM